MNFIGTTLGGYEIIAQIGRGGSALVFKARCKQQNRLVALKILAPHHPHTANFSERFAREARIVSQLDHPNILPIEQFGQVEEISYIAMPFIDGGTLKNRLKKSLPGLEETICIIEQIGSALDHAHQRGVLHRDVKPSNILLDQDNIVYLADFGLTKLLDDEEDDLTVTGMGLGTPTYISPEQGQGHPLDHHADIYSLGIVLYEMLTGKPPFKTNSPMATVFKHIHSPPRSPLKNKPDLPLAIEAVIYKVLAKSPTERYHSGAELSRALWRVLSGEDESASQIPIRSTFAPATAENNAENEVDFEQQTVQPIAETCLNFTLPLTPFIGRSQELAEIVDHLDQPDCRLLNLVGPGGVGKTRLMLEAVQQLSTTADSSFGYDHIPFTQGIYCVSLSPLNTVDQLVSAIAQALKFNFYHEKAGDEPPRRQLLNYLQEKNLLLVLDNMEHLLDGVSLLTEILEYAPGVKFLTTSRQRLNIRDEWVLEISGLRYPEQFQTAAFDSYGAIQLFLQHARRIQVGYTLPEEEIPYLIRICQMVEGLPLALELASSWARLLSCREIAQEIEQSLDFLSTSLYDVPERHRSLRGVFEYSWNRLSEQEQIIFNRLSVFKGGFQREAAQQVAEATLADLSSLLDKSFLRRTTGGHYRTHKVLRQFAAEKLQTNTVEMEEAYNRHAEFYAEFLQQREQRLLDLNQHQTLQEINAEIENIQAAWDWMLQRGRTYLVGQALGCLYNFYAIRSWLQEGVDQFERAANRIRDIEGMMHAFEEGPGTIYSRLLARQGRFYYRLHNYGAARELLQKSITISQHLKADAETAFGLHSLGNVAHRLGDLEEARQHYQDSLTIYRHINHAQGIANSMSSLGVVIHELGGQAKHLYEKSLEIFKNLGDQWGAAGCLNRLGTVALTQGQYAQAERLYEESLAICGELADQFGIARSLINLGRLAYFQGNYTEARRLYQESLTIFSDIGDRLGQATCLANLGDIARVLGEMEKAKELFQKSLEIYQKLDNQREVATGLNKLGRIAQSSGAYEEARQLFHQSLARCLQIGNHWGMINALKNLGDVACADKDFQAARQYFIHALHTATEMKAMPHILTILVSMATLMIEQGDKYQAVETLSLLDDYLRDNKETADQAQNLLNRLKGDLPPDVFAIAWEQGHSKTIEETVETILTTDLSPLAMQN